MANTKVMKSKKKISKSFSVTARVWDYFTDICSNTGLVPSNKIEELIVKFNEDNS